MIDIADIDPVKPVLIFGPTATGKSDLAIRIAEAQGGVIVNADALQVYAGWPILTAQPPQSDLDRVPHHLYGHLAPDAPYSAGDWLRQATPFLKGPRPIFVGGTGLYFAALTEGLADIPPTPPAVRAKADALPLARLVSEIDADTAAGLDLNNRARVQRAWEVQRATGRSIRAWQAETPPPVVPHTACTALALMPDVDWLNRRIAARFDLMVAAGALEEAREMQTDWDPAAPSSKAIGARDLIAVVQGQMTLDQARDSVVIATRQYAKRQRTWLRSRMAQWRVIHLPSTDLSTDT